MKPDTLRKATLLAAISIAKAYKRLGIKISPEIRDTINRNKLRRESWTQKKYQKT